MLVRSALSVPIPAMTVRSPWLIHRRALSTAMASGSSAANSKNPVSRETQMGISSTFAALWANVNDLRSVVESTSDAVRSSGEVVEGGQNGKRKQGGKINPSRRVSRFAQSVVAERLFPIDRELDRKRKKMKRLLKEAQAAEEVGGDEAEEDEAGTEDETLDKAGNLIASADALAGGMHSKSLKNWIALLPLLHGPREECLDRIREAFFSKSAHNQPGGRPPNPLLESWFPDTPEGYLRRIPDVMLSPDGQICCPIIPSAFSFLSPSVRRQFVEQFEVIAAPGMSLLFKNTELSVVLLKRFIQLHRDSPLKGLTDDKVWEGAYCRPEEQTVDWRTWYPNNINILARGLQGIGLLLKQAVTMPMSLVEVEYRISWQLEFGKQFGSLGLFLEWNYPAPPTKLRRLAEVQSKLVPRRGKSQPSAVDLDNLETYRVRLASSFVQRKCRETRAALAETWEPLLPIDAPQSSEDSHQIASCRLRRTGIALEALQPGEEGVLFLDRDYTPLLQQASKSDTTSGPLVYPFRSHDRPVTYFNVVQSPQGNPQNPSTPSKVEGKSQPSPVFTGRDHFVPTSFSWFLSFVFPAIDQGGTSFQTAPSLGASDTSIPEPTLLEVANVLGWTSEFGSDRAVRYLYCYLSLFPEICEIVEPDTVASI